MMFLRNAFPLIKQAIFIDKILLKVKDYLRYSSNKPVLLIGLHPIELFFKKSIHWAYEEEFRFIFPLLECTNSQKQDNFGNDICFFSLPKDVVTSIYMGTKIDPKLKAKIEGWLNQNQVSIPVFEMYHHPDRYILETKKVN
ncbi:hypothetical protein ACFL5V_11650 [Fibrobacterota bacterium]